MSQADPACTRTRSTASAAQVKVANIPGKKVDHNGIKVQLLGQIELASERGHPSDFLALSEPNSVKSQMLHMPLLLVTWPR